MNYQARGKTRVIEYLLKAQKGVQEFTEFVETGEDAYKHYAAGEEKSSVKETLEKDKHTLKVFKLTFNDLLRTIKPYEVEDV